MSRDEIWRCGELDGDEIAELGGVFVQREKISNGRKGGGEGGGAGKGAVYVWKLESCVGSYLTRYWVR